MAMRERDILGYIKELVNEEQRLFSKGNLSDEERNELQSLEVELNQFWDLLRQRRALKDAGKNPDDAKLRGPDTVQNYEQ